VVTPCWHAIVNSQANQICANVAESLFSATYCSSGQDGLVKRRLQLYQPCPGRPDVPQ
jgi:hypothetical protein